MEKNNTNETAMPYFKLFVLEELADFGLFGLDIEDYGAFCFLRNQIWAKKIVKFDEKKLADSLRISAKKFEKIWEKISGMFEIVDGNLTIAKLEAQRRKYNEFIENSRKGGQESGKIRRNVGSTSVEGSLNVGASNLNFKTHNSKSNSSNSQNSEGIATHTQPNAPASQSADGGDNAAPENGVCVNSSQISKFSQEERLEYAIACQKSGQNINSPVGLATKLENGKADSQIQQFFDSGRQLPKVRTARTAVERASDERKEAIRLMREKEAKNGDKK